MFVGLSVLKKGTAQTIVHGCMITVDTHRVANGATMQETVLTTESVLDPPNSIDLSDH